MQYICPIMLSHNQTKFLTALQVKKYRYEYRKFTVEGEKMVAELLSQRRIGIAGIYGLQDWAAANSALLQPFQSIFYEISEPELEKISGLKTPNKVLAVADMPQDAPPLIPADGLSFYLDGLQDPGNMGTILRIADWFGVQHVFCAPDSVDVYSPKVVQASMGAFLRLQLCETPFDILLEKTPGVAVLGAVLDGANVFHSKLPAGGALLIIGNEGKGIRPSLEQHLTHRLTIPRHPKGGAESLNASVATGILTALLQLQQ